MIVDLGSTDLIRHSLVSPKILPAHIRKTRAMNSFGNIDSIVPGIKFYDLNLFIFINGNVPSNASDIGNFLVELDDFLRAFFKLWHDFPRK